MVDRTNHHLFQPLLYQVATGVLSEGDIAPPIRDVLRTTATRASSSARSSTSTSRDRELTIDTLGRRRAAL